MTLLYSASGIPARCPSCVEWICLVMGIGRLCVLVFVFVFSGRVTVGDMGVNIRLYGPALSQVLNA